MSGKKCISGTVCRVPCHHRHTKKEERNHYIKEKINKHQCPGEPHRTAAPLRTSSLHWSHCTGKTQQLLFCVVVFLVFAVGACLHLPRSFSTPPESLKVSCSSGSDTRKLDVGKVVIEFLQVAVFLIVRRWEYVAAGELRQILKTRREREREN